MNITIDTSKSLGTLRHVADALTGPGRIEMLQAMGTEVQIATTLHVRDLAGTRHDTASRLGASPTNFLAQAADLIESPAALATDAHASTLTINHVGFARVFRDVTITMKDKRLTIPANALAYGRRAGEFGEIAIVHKGEPIPTDKPAYFLCRSVHQKQDRSLLPSDQEWQDAAAKGARNYLRTALQTGGNGQ